MAATETHPGRGPAITAGTRHEASLANAALLSDRLAPVVGGEPFTDAELRARALSIAATPRRDRGPGEIGRRVRTGRLDEGAAR